VFDLISVFDLLCMFDIRRVERVEPRDGWPSSGSQHKERLMMRFRIGWLAVPALLLGSALASAAPTPFAGTWKMIAISDKGAITLCLLSIDASGDKVEGKVIAAGHPAFRGAVVEGATSDGKELHLTIKASGAGYPVAVYLGKGDDAGKKMPGSIQIRLQYQTLLLEKTGDKEIDPMAVVSQPPGFGVLRTVREAKDDGEASKMLQDIATKETGKPVAVAAAQRLMETRRKMNAGPDELKAAAGLWVEEAGQFGPELANYARTQAANLLLGSEKGLALALDLARQADKAVTERDTIARQVDVLKLLDSALRKNGKDDEAKAVSARIAKLDDQLDKEFLKEAVPFKTEPFAGRKGKSQRVAVVELFTGAQCPPCVSADIAFDAAAKVYKPTDVVLLQYHLHIPGPDALTNPSSEGRSEYYGDVEGTPTMYLNGKKTPAMGGFRQHGEDRFKKLQELIDPALETNAGSGLKLDLKRQGDKIDIKATTESVKADEKLKLRLVLVEEVVRYPGNNGQRLHHHVVRTFPGGLDGVVLKDKCATQNVTVSLTELRKELQDALDAAAKTMPFHDDERPLALKHLKVVALVQNDDTKEIVQAVQADVPE
jgi:hypothetical protein